MGVNLGWFGILERKPHKATAKCQHGHTVVVESIPDTGILPIRATLSQMYKIVSGCDACKGGNPDFDPGWGSMKGVTLPGSAEPEVPPTPPIAA